MSRRPLIPHRAELVTPAGCTDAQARAFALLICGQATDRAEAVDLLAMCGLIDDDTAAANAAAIDQAAHEQWMRGHGYLREATR